jgi:predicted phage terminase large subunit-like protein
MISRRRFNTTLGGSFYAVGRGGPLGGRGAHLVIIDDPIKNAAEANSQVIRDSTFDWYSAVARTRLQARGAIVLTSTRWHEDDLPGRIMRVCLGQRFDVLCMPAIAERDETFRRSGEALWPEMYPLSELEKTRDEIGSANFMRLYQQRPAAALGTKFRREWWRFYREPPACELVLQSWDTAFKTGQDNDYSVCTTWGVNSMGYYLLSLWRGKVEFPELKRRVIWFASEWKPNISIIEDSASGQSLLQELRRANNRPILPIKVCSDKITRAEIITPLIEAGNVFLPESAPWLNDYIDELATFPYGIHDDMVDSTTLALNYLRDRLTNEVRVYTVYL